MVLGVSGTRRPTISFEDFESILNEVQARYIITKMVSGGAQGVDTFAKDYASKYRIPFESVLPEYSKYGKRAPIVRNTTIVEKSDYVIAFPSRGSRRTLDTIKKARKVYKLLKVVQL